mgnify:CR=1 FL=1
MELRSKKWLRLGRRFSSLSSGTSAFDAPTDTVEFYKSALCEQDVSLPIIGNHINRVALFDTLFSEIGPGLFREFSGRDEGASAALAAFAVFDARKVRCVDARRIFVHLLVKAHP